MAVLVGLINGETMEVFHGKTYKRRTCPHHCMDWLIGVLDVAFAVQINSSILDTLPTLKKKTIRQVRKELQT